MVLHASQGKDSRNTCTLALPLLSAFYPQLANFGLAQDARLGCAQIIIVRFKTRPYSQLPCIWEFAYGLPRKDNLCKPASCQHPGAQSSLRQLK